MEYYINPYNNWNYVYPRQYKYTHSNRLTPMYKNGDAVLYICGIPDGISPLVNSTLIEKKDYIPRLYICSMIQLDEVELTNLDNIYGDSFYEIYELNSNLYTMIDSIPIDVNYYYAVDKPLSTVSNFIEYKYLNTRNFNTNCIISEYGNQFKLQSLVLPRNLYPIVIIMPENFIKTSNTSGYFLLENNLIIKLNSDYLLSGNNSSKPLQFVTNTTTLNKTAIQLIKKNLNLLGFTSIYSLNTKIIAKDKYFTATIGEEDLKQK